MTALTPIPTRYSGYHFRSRLEARWAVFFGALGIAWDYEPQGFRLPSGPYLPDFWLAGINAYAEVKPTADAANRSQLEELATASGHNVLLLDGTPDMQWYACVQPGFDFCDSDGALDSLPLLWDWTDLAKAAEEGRCWQYFGGDERPSAEWLYRDSSAAVQAARGARFEFGETPR